MRRPTSEQFWLVLLVARRGRSLRVLALPALLMDDLRSSLFAFGTFNKSEYRDITPRHKYRLSRQKVLLY
jgi:hypothetical protein